MIFFTNLSRNDDSRIGDTSLSRNRGKEGEKKVGEKERERCIHVCCAMSMRVSHARKAAIFQQLAKRVRNHRENQIRISIIILEYEYKILWQLLSNNVAIREIKHSGSFETALPLFLHMYAYMH